MNLMLIFLSVLLAYVLAFWLVPKGNPLQEILQIPVWWVRMMRLPTSDMARTKIKYGTHWRQYLVVCTPKNGAPGRRGVIVYIHGGGWQFSRPEVFGPNAAEWVRAGFVVVMPSHRRIPFYHCDHLREDLKLILKKTVEWMEAHEMGASRLVLGGMSSGGNLAALAALDARGCRPPGFPADKIAGVFLLGAPLNLRLMRPSPNVYFFAGPRNGPRFKRANPIEFLSPGHRLPVLGIHGMKDGFVEFESALSFYQKLEKICPACLRFYPLPETTHLETAGWSFLDNGIREMLFSWLDEIQPPKQ